MCVYSTLMYQNIYSHDVRQFTPDFVGTCTQLIVVGSLLFLHYCMVRVIRVLRIYLY